MSNLNKLKEILKTHGLLLRGNSPAIVKTKFSGEGGVNFTFGNQFHGDVEFVGGVDLGAFTTLGHHTSVTEASVGGYCSIASDVYIGLMAHPKNWVSTSCFSYAPMLSNTNIDAEKRISLPFQPIKKTIIGHDVWIGQNVLIIGGVCIGTGSILAAGAIVTKDVPPYSIVGGNPARVIKPRFDDLALIDGLLESEWWRYNFPRIFANGV